MAIKQAARADGDSKSARTRRRILDAAAKVLSDKGYAGMRLSDVADNAAVQAPAIYYYFASREELVEEVMWFGLAQMRDHLVATLDALPDGTPPLERLLVAVEEHLRHELEISDYATASIRNAGQVPVNIRSRHRAEEKAYGEVWAGILTSLRDAGDLRPGLDLHAAQMLLFGAISWTTEWWEPRRLDLDSLVENAKIFALGALTGR